MSWGIVKNWGEKVDCDEESVLQPVFQMVLKRALFFNF